MGHFIPTTLFILKEKKCQTIPPGTLNVFYILVIHTDSAQMSFVLIALCQPGGAAINFSKRPRNQNWTTLLVWKNLSLPLTSASDICLGCTILELWIFLLPKLLWFTTDIEFKIVSNRSNFESKRIHNFKTMNSRQILLADVRDDKGFFLY